MILLSLPAVAAAGVFGGFAEGDRYRKGSDTLCTASAKQDATPVCEAASVAALAKLSFQMGTKQQGQRSAVSVQKKGSKLAVTAADDGSALAAWDAGQVIGGVGDVFLSPDKRWVAIEYQTRFAGRVVEDLVLLPIVLPKAVAPPTKDNSVPVAAKEMSEPAAYPGSPPPGRCEPS
jgi:hypothetical protein